jgi:hypothetical protein
MDTTFARPIVYGSMRNILILKYWARKGLSICHHFDFIQFGLWPHVLTHENHMLQTASILYKNVVGQQLGGGVAGCVMSTMIRNPVRNFYFFYFQIYEFIQYVNLYILWIQWFKYTNSYKYDFVQYMISFILYCKNLLIHILYKFILVWILEFIEYTNLYIVQIHT